MEEKKIEYMDCMDFIQSEKNKHEVLTDFMIYKGCVIDISLYTFRLISGKNKVLFEALCEFADM